MALWRLVFGAILAADPTLNSDRLEPDVVLLWWPRSAIDYVLEETDDLSSGSAWRLTLEEPLAGNEYFSLFISATGAERYFRLRYQPDSGLPPDPATVAPRVDPGIATDLGASARFLYSGPYPVQTGVVDGGIELRRTAVLQGIVLDTDGNPLPGARLTVLGFPELGYTLSRADGRYDLAVNGGDTLKLNAQFEGYLPVQRQVSAPWNNQVDVPPIRLLKRDPKSTVLLSGLTEVAQTAFGSVVQDSDGKRQAMVLMPPGVSASILTPLGATQAVSTVTTRLTEYTVGPNGPAKMPAPLPATVGYTYAIELSADEAQAKIDGRDVLFDQPVYFYVDNFIGLPTGVRVPTAYFNADCGCWTPSTDGWAVALMGTDGLGLAQVDANGDSLPDSETELEALGFSVAERRLLASSYGPTVTNRLWRVPIRHFSTYDLNYGTVAETGSAPPNQELPADHNNPATNPTMVSGYGDIEIENQVFRESIPLVGTPYRLHYSSARARGGRRSASVTIPLTGPNPPPVLKGVRLELRIAGRSIAETFDARPLQSYEFAWDGFDVYGRRLVGPQELTIRIGYEYNAYYALPPYLGDNNFGLASGKPVPGNVPAREDAVLWQEILTRLEAQPPLVGQALGGWTINIHHAYDPTTRTIYEGAGSDLRGDRYPYNLAIDTVAGTGDGLFSGDGGPAILAGMSPWGVAVRPNGELIFSDYGNHRIRRIDGQGIVTTIAGNGTAGFSGDGGPATAAEIKSPSGVALAPDGSLYFVDQGNNRIRRIGTDGVIATVAGNGTASGANEPNGVLAIESRLSATWGVAVGADCSVYYTDRGLRLRRLGADGRVSTLAGGSYGFRGEGTPAMEAWLYNPHSIALGQDGTIWFNDAENYRVRRITPDGIIHTVAGTGRRGFNGDGIPATQANLFLNWGVDVASDGTCYLTDGHQFSDGSWRVRRVGPDGIISTLAGIGVSAFSGDGGPAANAGIAYPMAMALSPDGALYFVDAHAGRIRKIYSMLPGRGLSDVLIPSEDGSVVYEFSSAGRHLRTRHAVTGGTLYEFSYNEGGQLARIADFDGQITTIERDLYGNPLSVTAPRGQRTTFALDQNGYLASVRNPGGEIVQLVHTPDGLLTSVVGAKGPGFDYAMQYNSRGDLIRVNDPAGGFTELQRFVTTNGYAATTLTAQGRTNAAGIESFGTGQSRRVHVASDGTITDAILSPDGTKTLTAPDGTITEKIKGPDPRFGMLAPLDTQSIVRLPSGLIRTNRNERALALTNDQPFGVAFITNLYVLNGQTFVSIFDVQSRTLTETTPLGRSAQVQSDAAGRPVREEATGLAPVLKAYNAAGRLTNVTVGAGPDARVTRFAYDGQGNLAAIIDPLNHTNQLTYDAVGRRIGKQRPDGSGIAFAYDAHGNLTALTPPARPRHVFHYNSVDLLTDYTPPPVSGATNGYEFTYNLDRQITATRLPDGETISRSYDSGGRVASLLMTTGNYAYGYGANGLMASISAPSGVNLAFGYDGSAQTATAWSGPITGLVTLTYDSLLQVRALAVNETNIIDLHYDSDAFLTNAGELQLTWRPQNHQLVSVAVRNAITAWERNAFSEVTHQSDRVNGQEIYAVDYHRDALGRINRKVETVEGVTQTIEYGYSEIGRLQSVHENGALTRSYRYDPNGNRLSVETAGRSSVTATYDDQDRLLQHGETTYHYGANGDLQSKTTVGKTTRFGYDALGNLLSVLQPDGSSISYVVDGLNRRVGKRINGALIRAFLYDGAIRPVAELDGHSAVVSVFVYGAHANVPDYLVKHGAVYRLITDHLGSPRLVVDAQTGSIAQRLDYDEWGRVTRDTNPGFQPFGFAGGLYDSDTGLVRFRARDYDAETGRWTTKDPQFFSGFSPNVYAYTVNDPVNYTDLTGFGPVKPNWPPPVRPPGQPLTPNEVQALQVLGLSPNPFVSTPAALTLFGDTMNQWAHGNAPGYAAVHDGANVVFNALGFLPGLGNAISTAANIADVSSQAIFTWGFNELYNPQTDFSHLRPNSDQDASTYGGLGAFK